MAKAGGGGGRGGGGGGRAVNAPFVSAHEARLARMRGNLPSIPQNIGSQSRPISGLNAQGGLFYRDKGQWYYNNPRSSYMRGAWTRGDPTFQDQVSISWSKK